MNYKFLNYEEFLFLNFVFQHFFRNSPNSPQGNENYLPGSHYRNPQF